MRIVSDSETEMVRVAHRYTQEVEREERKLLGRESPVPKMSNFVKYYRETQVKRVEAGLKLVTFENLSGR